MTTDDLKKLWQERSHASAGSRAGCLDEESFAALLSGDVSSKARVEAASHIALCQECADEFRALREASGLFEREPRPRSSRIPMGLALAAAILVAAGVSIALFWYRGEAERRAAELERQLAAKEMALVEAGRARDDEVAALREQLETAVSARLDVPIVDLDPFHATRGGARDPVPEVAIGESVDLVTLILNFPPRRFSRGLRVEVFDEEGALRFEGTATSRQEGASVNLTLSRAAAPAGLYRIRLSDDGAAIAEYRVRLRYAGEPG